MTSDSLQEKWKESLYFHLTGGGGNNDKGRIRGKDDKVQFSGGKADLRN